MDSKELRNLHEAYLDVYAPQENIEEGLRSAVKRLLGGGKKEAEAPKPESRGAQLRRRYNVGPEKSDTSAKRQILDRSRAKAEKDEKDYGDKPFQKQVAQKSKAAHDRYLKAGYSKYGAGDARGRGNKAAKRAAALNKEEFEIIVNALIEEGYDLSSYTWDEMYDICLDEANRGDENLSRSQKQQRRNASFDSGATHGRAPRMTSGQEAEIENMPSGGKAEVNRQKTLMRQRYTKNMRGVKVRKEEVDLYDVSLSHLIDEGYASTEEAATAIMVNMSEEWIEDIVEETLDERRNVTDRPLGIMHPFARRVRTGKGEKTELMGSDKEGNPTGKYLRMKHEKKAEQREKDADEQRRRDRDSMGRGTWDKD